MRIEFDSDGLYVEKVFFGCSSGNCAKYTGKVPEGYGKNLFNILGSYTKGTGTPAEWTITENSITVGTSEGNGGYMYYDKQYKNELNYVLSFVNTVGMCRPLLQLFDANGNIISDITITGWTYNAGAYKGYFIDIYETNVSIPFTLPSHVAYFKLGFVAIGYTVTNIQLELGTTATGFDAYWGRPSDEEEYEKALMNWATNANIQAYFVSGSDLYFDPNKDAELKTLWDLQSKKILWEGAIFMHGEQYITLREAISSQPNGIELVWSAYENAMAQNSDWTYCFVPKQHVIFADDAGINMHMSSVGFANLCCKYLYVSDTRIRGHASNNLTSTTDGITYKNNKFVLRYVLGV